MLPSRPIVTLSCALVLVGAAGCVGRPSEGEPEDVRTPTRAGEASPPETWTVSPVRTPAARPSGEPWLASDPDGGAWLSWLERGAESKTLRLAHWGAGGFAAPETVTSGPRLLANWADTPSVASWGDGRLAAHWLVLSEADPHAYSIRVATSADAGATWSTPVTPHRDGLDAEHGFVALVPRATGDLVMAWLDGRALAGGHGHGHGGGAMSLRATGLAPDGSLTGEAVLDPRTCDCCPTAAAAVGDDILLAYRDRSEDERRDVSLVRGNLGGWSAPTPLHADGWQIAGCPVNGPALAARGERIAIAWFTAAGDEPRVSVAISDDAGRGWSPPQRVDAGRPMGRAAVTVTRDGAVLVGWLEAVEEASELRVRGATPGALGPPTTVATLAAGRASGFPRLAADGDTVLAAWTSGSGDDATIAAARLVRAGTGPGT